MKINFGNYCIELAHSIHYSFSFESIYYIINFTPTPRFG